MTEIYGLFDAADKQNPDREYTSAAFARLFMTFMRDGVVHNDGSGLAVSPTVPAAMSVDVGTGMALVQGRYYINSADLTLTVEAADPSYPRIDRVVVRADLVGRTVHVVVKKGTAAASPVPPGLTRTAETWELSLAQVRVEAGATSIVAGKITDERGNTSLCGVAAPVYVPSSQVEVVGAVNMQSHALTGLPAPVNATDAARKGYVDTEIAGKIGSFGISQIAIDGDKNWNGKSITNIRDVGVAGKIMTPKAILMAPDVIRPANLIHSDNREVYGTGNDWVTLKSVTISTRYCWGQVLVNFDQVSAGSGIRVICGAQILNIQDVPKALNVEGGSVIELQGRWEDTIGNGRNTIFEVYGVDLIVGNATL